MLVLVYLLQLTSYLSTKVILLTRVETEMAEGLKMILRASIVIETLAESIDTMIIEVLAHIKLAVLIVHVICAIEVVILLFVAKMLNAMLLVKKVTLLDTAS